MTSLFIIILISVLFGLCVHDTYDLSGNLTDVGNIVFILMLISALFNVYEQITLQKYIE